MAGSSALCRSGMRFMHGLSAAIHVLFCLSLSFYNPCYKRDWEWLPVQLRVLLGYVHALVYDSCRVSDQDTTLRASDLYNARATILNPFINMFDSWYNVQHAVWTNYLFCIDNRAKFWYLVRLILVILKWLWLPVRYIFDKDYLTITGPQCTSQQWYILLREAYQAWKPVIVTNMVYCELWKG